LSPKALRRRSPRCRKATPGSFWPRLSSTGRRGHRESRRGGARRPPELFDRGSHLGRDLAGLIGDLGSAGIDVEDHVRHRVEHALAGHTAAQLPLTDWKGTDLAAATDIMVRPPRDPQNPPPAPSRPRRRSDISRRESAGTGLVIDRAKSVTDAAPLRAAIGAVWGAETLAPQATYDLLKSFW
jgi:hypothetical protein